jgi:hypothetical protein
VEGLIELSVDSLANSGVADWSMVFNCSSGTTVYVCVELNHCRYLDVLLSKERGWGDRD